MPRISRQPSAFTEAPTGGSDNFQRTARVELYAGPGVDVFGRVPPRLHQRRSHREVQYLGALRQALIAVVMR
jgi:hypothetical protein